MLNALESSLDAQRQLVADASHELRTPLASLRTNIEVLSRSESIGDDDRRALLVDVIDQLEELTELVGDLVELARDAEHEQEPADLVRLDLVVADAIERRRLTAGGVEFELDSEPSPVLAVERRLERAVANLLDNAVKWSPTGGRVEVRVAAGELCVRDHGPGSHPRTSPTSSIASTARRPPGGCRARASAWRSSARSPRRRVARSRSKTRRAVARCSRCGCPTCRPRSWRRPSAR